MLQHRSVSVQPSDVTGYRSDHWRRVWERGQIVADVTLYLVIGDIESLILWRQISMIGCIQHDMIALGEPVIIRYGLILVTLAAWSLSFSKVFWVQSLFHPTPFPKLAHSLHIYISEYVSCSLEFSTGRGLRVGRACRNLLEI